jgi:GAF domain-containing protein
MTDYAALARTIAALTEDETDEVALMATLACEIHHADDRFDWTGFYRVTAPGLLKIGPYQGGHGCLRIPFDRGVCGAAARTGEVQLVADVDAFEGHIACSSSTRSELVLPVFDAGGRGHRGAGYRQRPARRLYHDGRPGTGRDPAVGLRRARTERTPE